MEAMEFNFLYQLFSPSLSLMLNEGVLFVYHVSYVHVLMNCVRQNVIANFLVISCFLKLPRMQFGWFFFATFVSSTILGSIIGFDLLHYIELETGLMDLIGLVELLVLLNLGQLLTQAWLVLYFFVFVENC